MPNNQENDRLEMIKELRHANVPEDQILSMLDRYDAEQGPGGPTAPEYAGGGPAGAPPQVNTKGAVKQTGKILAGMGIVGGATMLGGLGAASLAPEGYGVLSGIAGQTGGSYVGELMRQWMMGEKISQREARKSAAYTAIPAAAGYIGTKTLSAAGGVPPAASEYVGTRSKLIPRFDLTMREAAPDAELQLGRKIGEAGEAQARPLTPGRIAEQTMIHDATYAGQRIDPTPMINELRMKMLKTPKMPAGRNTNRNLQNLINELEMSKARGGMTPDELDELLGGEMDPSIYSRGGKPSGQLTAKRLVPAREAGKESLLSSLPKGAREARTAAGDELTRRELASSYFGGSEKTTTNNIRNLFKPGNEGALESLQGVSKRAGIDFVEMARDISTKRVFSADDRVKAGMLHRIMLSLGMVGLATGKPGMMAAAVLSQPSTARFMLKGLAPMQMLLGPAGALMGQAYKKQYPLKREVPKISPHSEGAAPEAWKETRVDPEKMFPGMTNIGQENK